MKKLIVIADWARHSVYNTEYKIALTGFVNSTNLLDISSVYTSDSTIQAGFLLAQMVLTAGRLGNPQSTVIHMGTEPRNTSDPFLVIKLTSGIYLCGINTEYTFSFIKKSIDKAFAYKITGESTGFMSRDVYSRVVAHLLNSLEDDLELEEIPTNTISEISEQFVGHLDSFGNIITTIKYQDLIAKFSEHSDLTVTIGNNSKKATFKKNIWSGDVGELIIGPGSFGPTDNPYISIVTKSSSSTLNEISAHKLFSNLQIGSQISLH